MRNLLAIPFRQYQGGYSTKPFNDARGNAKGTMIVLNVLWSQYASIADESFAVNFNINAPGPNVASAKFGIQSVYIDNNGVDFPVYVYFNDTQFTITCPANTAGWFAVYTNSRAGIIAGLNMTPNFISENQRTALFFTDVNMVPFTDPEIASSASLWLASTGISRFSTAGYASPALGDQHLQVSNNLFVGGSIPAFIAQPDINFLYITQIQCVLRGFSHNGVRASATVAFQGSTLGGLIFAFPSGGDGPAATDFQNNQIILDLRGNYRFDAHESYSCAVLFAANVANGFLDWHFSFTYSNL